MSSSSSALPRWAYTFIPNKDVKVTPIILSLNVIIWLLMIANGISPIFPGTEDVMKWGATSTDAVTHGEYWRLWTSNYLHYGIIHLGVNMLSLNNVGRMLEQFIGWWRFALLYTISGICASAVSIWWNPYAVGVGASGAIVGLVGILLAILTTNLIEKSVRMKMLRSIAISAGLMVVIGMQANVDNAAHLGGLVAGMIGGYCIFPELKAHYYQRKKQFLGSVAALLVISGIIIWLVIHATAPRTPNQMMDDFNARQTEAINHFKAGEYNTPKAIDQNMIELYKFGIRQMDTIDDVVSNPDAVTYFKRVRGYFNAQLDYFEAVKKIAAGDSSYVDDAELLKQKAETAAKTMLEE
jgi:rhomboid protease GluP